MSNIEKAIEVAQRVEHQVLTAASYVSPPSPREYVEALADAGLLMPDLPEPDVVKLNGDIKYFAGEGKQVSFDKRSEWIQVMLNGPLLPTESRELAYALLAAAGYAEKEAHDE